MRIGLLGLGRIGSVHAENLASLPAVETLVVSDAVPSLARETADRLGAEVAASPESLLNDGVDGVVIAAPTGAHPALLLAAVRSGIPTFCEKPVAGSAAAGVEVMRQVAGSGVEVQIGYPRRFDAAFVAAREAVAGGELGWLHTIRSTTLDPAPPPESYVAVSGGIFRDCAVHDFDAVRWVTGREVVEVYATGGNRGAAFFAEHGDVDTSAAVLTFDDGTLGVISNTRYNARGYDVRLELHGATDSIAVGLEDRLPLRSVEPGTSFPGGPPHSFFVDRFRSAFRAELETFTEVVAGRQPSPCTLADALEAEWIAEACTISLRERRPVRINEVRPAR